MSKQVIKVDAPKQFTKTGVMEYLSKKGATGIMDTRSVAGLLGKDMQTIRRYVKSGRLKANMEVYNRAVYTLEDIADFILANPSVMCMSRKEFKVTDNVTELIRRIAYANWKTLTERIGIDDLVSEVTLRILQKKTIADGEDIGGVIQHILADIYRKSNREVKTVSLNEIHQEI